jgi:hypothetical protein
MQVSRYGASVAAAAVLAATATLSGAGFAHADPLSVKCGDQQSGETIRVSYEGDDAGTLTVAAPFGTAVLPAISRSSTSTVAGQDYAIRGIRANGPASLRMPDRAALEQCIVKRRIPGQPADKDIDFSSSLACQPELTAEDAPIDVTVEVSLALMDGEVADLVMHRIYANKSEVTGEDLRLTTMAFGSFQCEPAQ